MFSCGSNEKVWWKCSKGHEWQASISHYFNGRGCPYCAGKLIALGSNDLATLFPNLANEWDYNKNFPLVPQDVIPGSEKKVWWKCDKGHNWQAMISNRSKGVGCPYCSGRLVLIGVNDLETLRPDLVEEWDNEKYLLLTPKDVMPGTPKKAWWKCPKGNSWNSRIVERSKGCGCPYCAGRIVLPGFNDLASLYPNLMDEWHYERNGDLEPTNVTAGSSKKVWWKCSSGHEWQATISHRTSRGQGCPYCAGNRI